jgi:hypothetical protein
MLVSLANESFPILGHFVGIYDCLHSYSDTASADLHRHLNFAAVYRDRYPNIDFTASHSNERPNIDFAASNSDERLDSDSAASHPDERPDIHSAARYSDERSNNDAAASHSDEHPNCHITPQHDFRHNYAIPDCHIHSSKTPQAFVLSLSTRDLNILINIAVNLVSVLCAAASTSRGIVFADYYCSQPI